MTTMSLADQTAFARIISNLKAAPWVPFDSTAAEELAGIAVRVGFSNTTGDFMAKISKSPTGTLLELIPFAAGNVILAGTPSEVAAIDPFYRFELDLTGVYIPSFTYTGSNAGGIFSNNVLIEGFGYTGSPGQTLPALGFFGPGHAASAVKFFAGYFAPGAVVQVMEVAGGDMLTSYEVTADSSGYIAYCTQTVAPTVYIYNLVIKSPAPGRINQFWVASVCP